LYLAKRIMLSQFDCSSYPIELLLSEDALQQLPIDESMIQEAINFCDFERLSMLAIINPGAAMIF
jgi:hypothetical protein